MFINFPRNSMKGKSPRVRQVPFAYHTIVFGPVYAFKLSFDGKRARCCTWDDKAVECLFDELLPFRPGVNGADEIEKLDRDVDMGGPTGNYPKPRETTIGSWFLNETFFFNALKSE